MSITITAAEVLGESWYTPDSQKDDPKPTRFKVRPLSRYETLDVQSFSRAGELAQYVLTRSVVDWENVAGPDGQVIPFSADRLEALPTGILDELGAHILSISTPSEAQVKN